MTYFTFLALFLGIPIFILCLLILLGRYQKVTLPACLTNLSPWKVIAGHVLIALVYTTPWDNYLVATGVWWYDPKLVTGLTLGWVPIEEYTFFVLQPIFTGLWLLFLAPRLALISSRAEVNDGLLRRRATTATAIIWLGMVLVLISPWQAGTYLALEIGWAFLPLMLQLAFGADILWHYRRLVIWGIIPPTLYLALADTIAISAGTWTIDPDQSLPILLGGILPLEEFIFFLLTNTLVVFGVILAFAEQSQGRVQTFYRHFPKPT